jgi:glycosyltransferase involved in cell wall biosynthesis
MVCQKSARLRELKESTGVRWHIITGEYPPKRGGVGDYTYLLARALAEVGDDVHIWTPGVSRDVNELAPIGLHVLPPHFGLRWLLALHRGLAAMGNEATVLVQYVPHMYGWKAMNLAFCFWLALQRKKKTIWVMFHEVAFPFRSHQPLKHDLLAVVHRLMAWIVLRSAAKSFTSIEPYKALLTKLAPRAQIEILRLFSNVPFGNTLPGLRRSQGNHVRPLVGMFSSFAKDTREVLNYTLPALLKDSTFDLLLVGPGANFIRHFSRKYPMFKHRLYTSGRVNALEAGPYIQTCDVLVQLYPEGACGARGTFTAALASGVPVVTTAGPLTESLFSGAVAFAEDKPQALRHAIETLLADKAAARNLGVLSRRLYEDHFDLSVAVAALTEGRVLTPAERDIA